MSILRTAMIINLLMNYHKNTLGIKLYFFFYHPFELSRIEEIIYQFRDLSKESIEIVLIGDIDLDQSDLKNNYIYASKLIKIYKLFSK